MREERLKNRFYPYETKGQYSWAKRLSARRHESQADLKSFILEGDHIADTARFESVRQYVFAKDELTGCLAEWHMASIESPGKEAVSYYFKDSLAILQEILENKELADQCTYAPKREYNSEGERIYTDMYSGDFWWNMQVRQISDNAH